MEKHQGFCEGCHKPIPFGALIYVSSWKTIEQTPGVRIQKPDKIHCSGCKHLAQINPSHSAKVYKPKAPETPQETVQDQAKKLYKAASVPMTSKALAQKAGVVYSNVVEAILKKLAEKQKMKVASGMWVRV